MKIHRYQSIKGYFQSGTIKIIKKKLFKIFLEIIIFENSNQKWLKETQTYKDFVSSIRLLE